MCFLECGTELIEAANERLAKENGAGIGESSLLSTHVPTQPFLPLTPEREGDGPHKASLDDCTAHVITYQTSSSVISYTHLILYLLYCSDLIIYYARQPSQVPVHMTDNLFCIVQVKL